MNWIFRQAKHRFWFTLRKLYMLWFEWSSGLVVKSWEGLLLVLTDVSTTWAEAIIRVMMTPSDDGFRSGCRNVSQHQQQSFSGLHYQPGRSLKPQHWLTWVQTFHCYKVIYVLHIICNKIRTLKFRTLNFRTLSHIFKANFGEQFRWLHTRSPESNKGKIKLLKKVIRALRGRYDLMRYNKPSLLLIFERIPQRFQKRLS